ncbi:kinase-like domain-containing protein [Catenaria anguillulae PL171]|uniref:Kinase-like domain-containing protein n=1 Tax=Catenaria anguillulae PL171 TaxID=765915 RepID=A0A1Y2H556_9FUNG|nr:kinase-like domain-containing protein [Catenaria anguillulae PL171]
MTDSPPRSPRPHPSDNSPNEQSPESAIPTPTSCADFTVLKLIGTGGFAKACAVYLVQRIATGDLYAMKVMHKIIRPKLSKAAKKKRAAAAAAAGADGNAPAVNEPRKAQIYHDGMNERQVLVSINEHPFLVTLRFAFQDERNLYLILDWAEGGELWGHLATEGICMEDEVTFYVAEILLALEKLHSMRIVYRDLKLENVLIDGSGHIKLTDMGLAKIICEDMQFRANSWRGTFGYMAPEMISRKPYDERVDTWGLGVLTYLMLTGDLPFNGKSPKEVETAIINRKPKFPHFLTREAISFINAALTKDPTRRPTMTELKYHPFFRHIDFPALLALKVTPPRTPPRDAIDKEVSTLLRRVRRVQSVMAEGTVSHTCAWGDLEHPIEAIEKAFRDFQFPPTPSGSPSASPSASPRLRPEDEVHVVGKGGSSRGGKRGHVFASPLQLVDGA